MKTWKKATGGRESFTHPSLFRNAGWKNKVLFIQFLSTLEIFFLFLPNSELECGISWNSTAGLKVKDIINSSSSSSSMAVLTRIFPHENWEAWIFCSPHNPNKHLVCLFFEANTHFLSERKKDWTAHQSVTLLESRTLALGSRQRKPAYWCSNVFNDPG